MTSRRNRQWEDTDIAMALSDGVGQIVTLVSGDELRNITGARIVLDLTLVPTSVSATNSGVMRVHFGIEVASNEAVNAGIASVPNPSIMSDFPPRGWLVRGVLVCAWENTTGVVEAFVVQRSQMDLRANRRVDNGQMILVAESNDLSGTQFNVTLTGLIRVMCLV